MIQGFVQRRNNPTLPSQPKLVIEFNAVQPTVSARITHFSPKMALFYLPKGGLNLAPESQITLIFSCTGEEIACHGEVDYFCPAWDKHGQLMFCYGMKLMNITPEQWTAIHLFCQGESPEMPVPGVPLRPAGVSSHWRWPVQAVRPSRQPEGARSPISDDRSGRQVQELDLLTAIQPHSQRIPGSGEELAGEARESLADILYGETIPSPESGMSQTSNSLPETSSAGTSESWARPQSIPGDSSRHDRETGFNASNSSISMDQAMIDRIIRSLRNDK